MTGIKSDSEGEVEGDNRDKVGKLNPTKVESTIESSVWWAFTLMTLTLHRLLTRFQEWCESCPCHWSPNMFDEEHLRTWTKRCRELGIYDVEGPNVPCPLGGLRAAELAVSSSLQSLLTQSLIAPYEPHPRNAKQGNATKRNLLRQGD